MLILIIVSLQGLVVKVVEVIVEATLMMLMMDKMELPIKVVVEALAEVMVVKE